MYAAQLLPEMSTKLHSMLLVFVAYVKTQLPGHESSTVLAFESSSFSDAGKLDELNPGLRWTFYLIFTSSWSCNERALTLLLSSNWQP